MKFKWGIYPWFKEHGFELIHPDDLGAFTQEASNCKVFECVDDGGYLTLRYNGNYYRVKGELFKPVPPPEYTFGETVRIKKNGDEAVITDIMWHYDKREHYYFVSVKGKKCSRRYSAAEFMRNGNDC